MDRRHGRLPLLICLPGVVRTARFVSAEKADLVEHLKSL